MLKVIDQEEVPLRLTLGSIAYRSISKTLTERLAALEAQKKLALSADWDL
jgi:hypothetical protein